LLIERIPNPLAVVCDPGAREPTRCDMKWGFVTELVPKADFLAQYPDISASTSTTPTEDMKGWVEGDFVRVAEYWRKRSAGKKKLYALKGPQGQQITPTDDELAQNGMDKPSKDAFAALGLTLVRSARSRSSRSRASCSAVPASWASGSRGRASISRWSGLSAKRSRPGTRYSATA
jgi:hypothetical protein